MKVFLSYAHADARLAKVLAAVLSSAGYQVFSGQDLLPGDNFAQQIGEALEESEAMVVLISPASVDSPWVKKEIDFALGSPNYAGRLIPVVVRPTAEMPWILRRLDPVRAGKSPAEVGKRVIEALEEPRKLERAGS